MSALALALLGARVGVAQVSRGAVEKSAGNLLANPNFDTGIAGWDSGAGTVRWDPSRDADGSPSSGSLQLSVTGSGGSFFTQAFQCVNVTAGTYELSGKIFAPTGTYPAAAAAEIDIQWNPTADCTTSGPGGPRTSAVDVATTQNSWVSVTTGLIQAPAGTHSAYVIPVASTGSTGTVTANFDDLVFQAVTGPCVPGATTLCIDNQPGDRRFELRVHFFSPPRHQDGDGAALSLSPVGITQGGAFAFFSANNPEMLIKVLNGCALGGHYWVFFAAVTDVGFTVSVRDTATGALNTYSNPDMHAATPVQDTGAFGC